MRKTFFAILLSFIPSICVAEGLLVDSHDITGLHPWGPYSKRYAGISHIADINSGVRFDFSVMPGYYRNRQFVPHVLFESSYYPWDINPEMTRITYRYEMEWKDKVYTDVSYHLLDSCFTLVEMECVNNTPLSQNLVLNLMAYIDYESEQPSVTVDCGPQAMWTDAMDYVSNNPVRRWPQYNLVYDGALRNEVRRSQTVGGFALSGIGHEAGHNLKYNVMVPQGMTKGYLGIRYEAHKDVRLAAAGIVSDTLHLSPTDGFGVHIVPMEYKGDNTLTLTALGGEDCTLDGFFIATDSDAVRFTPRKVDFTPDLKRGKGDFIVKYPVSPAFYGVAWNFDDSEIREVLDDNLESFFRKKTHDHVSQRLHGNGRWHYTDAFLRPVVIEPQSTRRVFALIATGDRDAVRSALDAFHADEASFTGRLIAENNDCTPMLPGAEKFATGARLLQASLLSNIVYPVHTQGQYIRHFTPGKNWNSLYTWDSGFIAIGLADVDSDKAFECLRAYTTSPGSESAFIHHGTPLPIQIYAWQELWNRGEDMETLKFIYPRLKQFYDFMAGHSQGSTTAMKGTGLIRTWDYFYNSGGWDDYPPQIAPQDKSLVTPVVSTAYYIRAARILRRFAQKMGLKSDVKYYDKDIERMTLALQKYAWDEESGYYGYVVHNADGDAVDIFRTPDGTNFNMGLDGVSPLVAGISNESQREVMLSRLFDSDHLWTPVGLSTVDRSAPYYRRDGYWNGAVWFPHQWLLWKSMLDLGEADRAWQIASTALEAWERECSESYFTFEHFIIASGRGAGWHQFSGLSSPLLNWYASYFRPGKVSTGFETFVDSQVFSDDYSSFDGVLSFDDSGESHRRTILLCMAPGRTYSARFGGKAVESRLRHDGLLEVTLPPYVKGGKLTVRELK